MSVDIEISPCSNITLLTRMYKELAEDEKSDAPQTDEQYQQCMEGFLKRGDHAFVFLIGRSVIGYALVITDRKPYYLRHFYITRTRRRKGCGSAAFRKLLDTLGTQTIDLDVFVWNECGIGFWQSLGFEQRAHLMRLQGPPV